MHTEEEREDKKREQEDLSGMLYKAGEVKLKRKLQAHYRGSIYDKRQYTR